MASGDTLCTFTPHANEPPLANYAVIDVRNSHLVLSFDAATAQSAVFGSTLARHYAGSGITATLVWMAATATTGNVKWNAQFERHQSAADDLDADSFATAQTTTSVSPVTSGLLTYATIAFTNGAQMDSLAVGESFRLKVTRDAADAADTMTGAAQLLRVELRET